jgi:hypothetical protein
MSRQYQLALIWESCDTWDGCWMRVSYSTLHEYMLLDDLVSATFVFLYRLRGEEWITCRICAMDVKL